MWGNGDQVCRAYQVIRGGNIDGGSDGEDVRAW
jgi:hypothetical protein